MRTPDLPVEFSASHWTRRDFLKAGAALVLGAALPTPLIAATDTRDFWVRPRTLWLRRAETQEEYHVEFWTPEGGIDLDNYLRLCYLMRDVSEQAAVTIDANLFNLFYGIQYWDYLLTGRANPYLISSGHRTPLHNSRVEGAAKNSLHIGGRAGDGHQLGRSIRDLVQMGAFFKMGGVGQYDTFAHFDTGALKFWDGRTKQKHPPQPLFAPR